MTKKFIIYPLLLAITIIGITIFVCDTLVVYHTKNKSYTNAKDIPSTEYGLLLGTTPQTRLGERSDFFKFRIDATEELYKAQKINVSLLAETRIVLTGLTNLNAWEINLLDEAYQSRTLY